MGFLCEMLYRVKDRVVTLYGVPTVDGRLQRGCQRWRGVCREDALVESFEEHAFVGVGWRWRGQWCKGGCGMGRREKVRR